MRKALLTYLLILTAGLCPSASAQEIDMPDTTSAWRFFPLEVGNRWVYDRSIQIVGPNDVYNCPHTWKLESFRELRVLEEIEIDGKKWFRAEESSHDLESYELQHQVPGLREEATLRFDSESKKIVELLHDGTTKRSSFSPCNLDGRYRYESECATDLYFDREWTGEIGGEPVSGVYKGHLSWTFTAWFDYVSDIGLISKGRYDCGGYKYDLIYAEVGARSIGTLPAVATGKETESVPTPVSERIHVFPNPVSSSGGVVLEGLPAGKWDMEWVDVLGRIVFKREVQASARNQPVFPDLAPGIYFIRAISVDGGIRTGSMMVFP